jgi:ADP-heptose:LPS heptosyltransferase
MQILIIQTAFLGDLILSTALIEKLKKIYPDSSIDILIKKGNEKVLNHHPEIRNIFLFDKGSKFNSFLKNIKEIRSFNYDLSINLHKHFSTGLFSLLLKAKQKIGFSKNPLSVFYSKKYPYQWEIHEINRIQSLIEHSGYTEISKPKLYPGEEDWKLVEAEFKNPYISISPASIWPTKRLPNSKWVSLINQIPDHLDIYLMGGPDDINVCQEISKLSSRSVKIIASKYHILTDAAIMARSQMNYVLDSAPLHICSAMNAPQTVIYCSTAPKYGFGPLSDISIIIETNESLTCRPCGPHGHKKCPEGHFKCSNIDLIFSNTTKK